MNRNRWIRALACILLAFAFTAYAQTECPPEMVCISREAALKALEDSDVRKAQEAEIKVLNDAIAALRKELADIRTEYARASGENTILKQRAVSDAALIELLTKMVRPKKFGLIVF